MTILDAILTHKAEEVAARMRRRPLAEVRRAAECLPPALSLRDALARPRRPTLIAEIKRASPSMGLLRPDLDPERVSRLYAANGAAAISVLTDSRYFHGGLADLERVSRALPDERGVPVLQKDFVIDPYQVYEARAFGADAILLIVAALADAAVAELHACAAELGMDVLVEVHAQAELERAMCVDPVLVGINNRDLATFKVDLETTSRLRTRIPTGITVVAESGIHSASDVDRVRRMGVDAILVGESIVTSPDLAAKVRELAGAA